MAEKAKVKRRLFCRLDSTPDGLMLVITEGKRVRRETEYALSGRGPTYTLHKRSPDQEVYTVRLSPSGSWCNCRGFRSHERCKHISVLAALAGCGPGVSVDVEAG